MAIVPDSSGTSLFPLDKTNASYVGVDVTPSDTVNLDRGYFRILAGVAGNVVVRRADGTTQTFALPAGVWTTIGGFNRVLVTGTTATGIKVSV